MSNIPATMLVLQPISGAIAITAGRISAETGIRHRHDLVI